MFSTTKDARRAARLGTAALTLAILAVMAGPAHASAIKLICGTYNGGEQAITLEVSNRCTSSSFGYLGHDVKADIDEDRATIALTGGFNYSPPKSKMVTRDCMNTRKIDIKVPDVGARRYSVMLDGIHRGVLDFSDTQERRCLTPINHTASLSSVTFAVSKASPSLMDRFLPNSEGPTIQEVIEPLLRTLSVSGEGGGSLDLSIERVAWVNAGAPQRAIAKIEAHGFGDDSVSGMRFTVTLFTTEKGWKAHTLQRQQMCARGESAGQWTHGTCG